MSSSPRAERDRVRSFIRRRPLTTFFLWFFTVGQAFAFTPALANSGGGQLPVQPFIVASTLVGLLLPAVVITRLVDGPEGLRTLWRRALDVRVSLAWYALAVVGVPLLAVAIAVVLLGPPSAPASFVPLLLSGFVLPLVLTFVPNNLWEEVAWMGFVQARLQDRRGPLVAALLTGPLFAVQHISLVVGSPVGDAVIVMTLLVVLSIPFRFLTGWVYNRTSSLFLVGLLHATGNAVAGGSGFHPGLLARLYPGEQVATLAHLLAFFLVGLAVAGATRGRLGLRTHSPGDRTPESRSAPARPGGAH